MFLDVFLVGLGGIALVAAFVGCIVPVVPGPILGAIALILVSVAGEWAIYGWATLIGWFTAAILVQILDNVLPARAAGRAGAGTGGVWGSVIGMIAGTVLFPPFGVFIGAFLGAFVGEVLFHRENERPLLAAIAVFRGTLGAIILKLAVTGAITFVFIRGAIRLFS